MIDQAHQTVQRNRESLTEEPRVSVVLAVYNGEQYLRESIDSILSQTYKSFEFIIVNDGSTDGTSRILQSYSTNSHITILTNSINKGLTESLNLGMSVARGEFVARIDSDDISVPQRLDVQVKYLDSNPETWLVGSWFNWISEGKSRNTPFCPVSDKHFYKWSLAFYCPFLHSSAMFRKAKVEQAVGLYDPKYVYSMDYDLWSRISEVAEVDIVPEILAGYREHDSSMTSTMPDASHNEPLEIASRIFQGWNTSNEQIELDSELVIAMRNFWLSDYDLPKNISVDHVIGSIQYFVLEFCANHKFSEERRCDFIDSVNSKLLVSYIQYVKFHSNRYQIFKPKTLHFLYRKFGFKKLSRLFFTLIARKQWLFKQLFVAKNI